METLAGCAIEGAWLSSTRRCSNDLRAGPRRRQWRGPFLVWLRSEARLPGKWYGRPYRSKFIAFGGRVMFKRQTLFVLGAGSSAEVGLSPGTKLAETIGGKLDIRFEHGMEHIGQGDLDLYQNVTRPRSTSSGEHRSEFQFAAWRIRDGIRLAQSIDDFLDLHRSDRFMTTYGKAAIVKSVLEAERNSKLHYNRFDPAVREAFNPALIAGTWFVKFMHMLGRGILKESAETLLSRVLFINFNYDRCLEHFLSNAIQHLYSFRDQDLPTVLGGLRVIHPYGAIAQNVGFR